MYKRIWARGSVFQGRSGRLRGIPETDRVEEVRWLVVDMEARWSARVLVLLLLLLRIVECTGWVLALAGIAEGINEESASSVDRVWFKGSGG